MKKTLYVFLTAAVILLMTGMLSGISAASPTVTVASYSAASGETVAATVSVSDNPGIASLKLTITYDSTRLRLDSIDYNGAFGGMTQLPETNSSPVILNWFNGLENYYGNSVFATLNFTVLSTAAPGDAPITVSYNQNDVYNIAETDIAFAIVNGNIAVTCKHLEYGDWQKHSSTQHKHLCSACGEPEYENHNWNAGIVTTQPTCKDPGERTYTCTVCGETRTEPIAKLTTHTYGNWQKHTATQHKRVCTICGNIDYSDHRWNAGAVTTQPTCKDPGERTYTCTVCGETRTEPIAKLTTHTYGDWQKHTATQHKRVCTICGNIDYSDHNWNAGAVTTQPTCKDPGERTYTCTVCGETRTEPIAKLTTHTYGNWQKHTATQHKRVCTICGNIDYSDHRWNAGAVTTQPTCKDPGERTYTCTVCGETRTEPIAKLTTHTYGDWQKHTATQHKRVCTICGNIDYSDHNWNAGAVTTQPTCKDPGERTYTCTVCGETRTEPIAKLTTHTYGNWQKHTATQHKRVCTICGNIDYSDHNWNAGVVTKNPTTKDTGMKVYTCTLCGETKNEVLPIIYKLSDLLKASSSLRIDPAKGYIHGIPVCKTVADILTNFDNTDNIRIVDKNGQTINKNSTAYVGTGCKIQVCDAGGQVVDEVTVIVRGDIDGTGDIELQDCIRIRSTWFDTYTLTGPYLEAAITINKGATHVSVNHCTKVRSHYLGSSDMFAEQ